MTKWLEFNDSVTDGLSRCYLPIILQTQYILQGGRSLFHKVPLCAAKYCVLCLFLWEETQLSFVYFILVVITFHSYIVNKFDINILCYNCHTFSSLNTVVLFKFVGTKFLRKKLQMIYFCVHKFV